MPNPRLATRYAKSVLDLATERNQQDQVFTDMVYLQGLVKSNRDLVTILRSPVVPGDKKKKVMDMIVGGAVSELTSAFIRLLITKGREGDLPEVVNAYIRQYKTRKGIHTVKLTTATTISDQMKKLIIEQVKKTGDMQNIELETVVDPKIIGGFVLQAGDKLVDASIAYDLKAVSKQFENNDFIYKIR